MEPWIQTVSGRAVALVDTNPASIVPEDIAHALSYTNRYTGHTRYPYSVALHTIRCARIGLRSSPAVALAALLHDAHEAYISDVAAPLKRLLPEYQKIEARIERIVTSTLAPGLYRPARNVVLQTAVKNIDRRMLMTEAPDLLVWPPPRPWGYQGIPSYGRSVLRPWAFWERWPSWQRRTWLSMYRSLCRACGIVPK